MPGKSCSPRVAWVPLAVGSALWMGATALLLEDAYKLGHVTVQHALMPILTASTVAAAVYAERRLRQWKVVGFIGFATLALLGSVLTVYSTLGRVSEAHDFKVAVVKSSNDQTTGKQAELKTAREARDKECKSIGPKCERWNKRVDELQRGLVGHVTTEEDSQLESALNFVNLLVTVDDTWLRKLLRALAAIGLPTFLEMGSIGFFAAAFPHRATIALPLLPSLPATVETLATVEQSFSRDQALADFRKLGFSGSQHFLSDRWSVHPATVSKWFTVWEATGLISRERNGKSKATLALPDPARRKRLGQMVSIN